MKDCNGSNPEALKREIRHQANVLDVISVAQTQADAIEFVAQKFSWMVEAQPKPPLNWSSISSGSAHGLSGRNVTNGLRIIV